MPGDNRGYLLDLAGLRFVVSSDGIGGADIELPESAAIRFIGFRSVAYNSELGTIDVTAGGGIDSGLLEPQETQYGDLLVASFDVAPFVPANCVVKATVHWCAGVLTGDASDQAGDIIAEHKLLITYRDGDLSQIEDSEDWLSSVVRQYHAVSAVPFYGLIDETHLMLPGSDSGNVTSSLQVLSELATPHYGRARLVIDNVFERQLLVES